MKIDKKLNLIVPVYEDDEKTVRCHVHSTPISRETFEKYFLVISQTFGSIYNQGLGKTAGPAVSMLLLKMCAERDKSWDGDDGVEKGLVEEIRRLTTVVVPASEGGGWQTVPLKIAADRGFLTKDDMAEVENAIVFFIVNSAMLQRAQRREMLEEASNLWGARISSSTPTEFIASLPKSTATAHSGEPQSAPAKNQPSDKPANAAVDGKPASVPV